MDKKEIELILQEGEGYKIEFKESFDLKGLSKEIVAFTNASGGRIFLGINDDNVIKGIDINNRLKLIADLFARIRWVERIGGGFARMKDYCRKVNAPIFKLDIDEKYFRVIFFRSEDYLKLADIETTQKTTQKVGEKVGEKLTENILNERQKKAIDYLNKTNRISTRNYLIINPGIKERTARYDLNDLVKKNIIIKIGSTASAYYKMKSSAKLSKVRQKKEEKEVIYKTTR